MAATVNFTIDQGTTFRKSFWWKDSTGTAIPLTGYTAVASLKNKSGGSDHLDLSTTNGGITLNATPGQIDFHIPASGTATLVGSRYEYNLDITAPSGDSKRLFRGRAKIEPSA